MKRQPGLEVAEKLSIMQRSLNIKTRKMKELAAQINMYQAKVTILYILDKRKQIRHLKSEQIDPINKKKIQLAKKKITNSQIERKNFATNVIYMRIHFEALINIL